MKPRSKQADVARLAGVSRTTVSFVLNERVDSRVPISEITRQKVLDAARQLGYAPNDLARSLRAGTSQTIGFLMPTFNNPHYWEILAGAEEIITAEGFHLSLAVANLDPERELACLHALTQQRLDGLVVIPTFIDRIGPEQGLDWAGRLPVVITQPVAGSDWVFFDFDLADSLVMDHLIALGHHCIGLIEHGARQDTALARKANWHKKLASVGTAPGEAYFHRCNNQPGDGYMAARQLLTLPNPPSAIWAVNDLIALEVLHAAVEMGLHVPADLSIIGFDDLPLAAQISPPLTTVSLPARQLGRRAAEILFQRIKFPDSPLLQETFSPHLVLRHSTGPIQERSKHGNREGSHPGNGEIGY